MSILSDRKFTAFLSRHANHASGARPAAVFDCDGTVIKGDVGEAMFYRQIEHFLFRHSPAELWPDHPRRGELDERFRRLSALAPAERKGSADFAPFADILLSHYYGQIAEGLVAKACSDIVRLLAGFTPAEARTIAAETFADELAAPLSMRRLGGRDFPRGIRFLVEAVDLLTELQKRNFEIWAVSGSNRWSVEPVFAALGIGTDRVIGLEIRERDGVLVPEPLEPVPIREGKIPAFRRSSAQVPVLVASDSKNDVPLFLYSSDLKVRINSRGRDTDDFFRFAGVPADESWILIESPGLSGTPRHG
jgi:phosphoserine phosphatase